MKRLLPIFLSSFILFSCAHVISKDVRAGAVKDASFSAIKGDIEKYKGRTVIWGGFIVKTRNTDEGTWLEIVQTPINGYGHILQTDESEGRFLAVHKGHLDTLIYERGRLVTVAGEVAGIREATIDEMKYVYPVVEIKEIYLWKEDVIYSAYPVSYYPWWWYDPWWNYPYIWP